MVFEYTFLTGVACGVCICALFFKRRLLFRPAITPTVSKSESKVYDDGEYKMVLVIRSDLKMGKGKVAAQCAHAAVGAYAKTLRKNPAAIEEWEYTGQAKVALRVDSDEELMSIHEQAKKAGLITSLIRDAGRTQIAPNTRTVVGVGPANKNAIDCITGHLKLF